MNVFTIYQNDIHWGKQLTSNYVSLPALVSRETVTHLTKF